MFESGVHATIAGVVLGLLTPTRLADGSSPVETLEHALHPWTSFVIVPLFALANAGVVIDSTAMSRAWSSSAAWGIFVGLVVGKLVGVTLASAFGLRTGIGRRPAGLVNREFVGIGALAGIGFTVALFIAELAFADEPAVLDEAKIAVLAASVVSALLGACILLGGRRGTVVGAA
jgi:NhaA family Na+:H+ antiporter